MTQTVIGVFGSFVDASSAQRALVDAHFRPDDISVYSTAAVRPARHGPRAYAHCTGDVHHGPVAASPEQRESLEQLERLFARTFRLGEYPLETESYREAIRRGGAIVSVDTSDANVGAAQETLTRSGAVDINDLVASWRRGDTLSAIVASQAPSQSSADMQVADAAGETDFASKTPTERRIESVQNPRPTPGSVSPDTSSAPGTIAASGHPETVGAYTTREVSRYPQGLTAPPAVPSSRSQIGADLEEARGADRMSTNMNASPTAVEETSERANPRSASDAGVAVAPGGTGRSMSPDRGTWQNQGTAAGARRAPLEGTTPEDEWYEEEFRRDYDTRYASTGAPYKDYQQAYRHGATLGQNPRYREYDWPDVEADIRRRWETAYPDSGWDRFKAAVRHGWARVTGRE